jgi:hypothetical protein
MNFKKISSSFYDENYILATAGGSIILFYIDSS